VPRLAQRRVILFFWPTRASSANQISMASGSTPFSRSISSRRSGRLFKILDGADGLRVMTRTSRQLAVAHGAQFAAQCLFGDHDVELLPNPLAQIDDPPAYDAVNGWDRTALDDRGQRRPMRIVQPRRLPGRLSIDQAVRPVSVELENPIANDLKRHAANLGRLGARGAFVNRRQSQKSPRLRSILRAFGGQSDRRSVKIIPERKSHGKPPGFATLNQLAADLGSPESRPSGLGIMRPVRGYLRVSIPNDSFE
jgi:hypothetical protein